ncbi:oligosaccharide flippase family protein [Treponema sp. OMZ 788]|uniref:oligosaccharide flippase family protein n=1 Tax=Treponema sp. OMZ 788 TaxID=2563664 RepID=UPI0020A54626|nr:oligosaccharide flippase family protein [Treponema sp. OMZ 788]UTC65421.1 oligosaccharide flippase family protein [Treponema sp. OMZ 788]
MQLYLFIKKIISRGGLHIFLSSACNKLFSFFSVVIIARVLSKNDYGVYGYSYNFLDFFILFQGIGLSNGILQFASETNDLKKQNMIAVFSLKLGTYFNIILIGFGFIFSVVFNFKIPNANHIFRYIVGLLPLSYVIAWGSSYLRSKDLNKSFALLSNSSSFFLVSFSIAGAYYFGLYGYIFGKYLGYISSIILLFFLLKNDIWMILRQRFKWFEEANSILKYSVLCMLTNTVSHSLYLVDVFVIGLICPDASILADYKIAAQIPFSLYFVPLSIITFIYPYFARNRLNFIWLKTNTIKLLLGNFLLNLIIGLILIFFAEKIIVIVYTEKYLTILPIFKVLILSYIVSSTLRVPIGNLLSMLRYVKYNLISSICIGFLNILLNYYFIKFWSSLGAAFSTLLTVLISGLMDMCMYLFVLNRLKKTVV